MPYTPVVAWTTIVNDVVMVDETTYDLTVIPTDPNQPGAEFGEKAVGYYLTDNAGHKYTIVGINIGGDPNRIRVSDDFGEHGPQSGQYGYVYKSVGDGKAPYLAPIRYQRLDESALDYSRAIELDVIWKNLLRLDQDPRQVAYGGTPRFDSGIEAKYIDFDQLVSPPHKEGRVFYDPTKRALSVYNDIPGITHNLGREYFKRTKRASSELTPILNGQIVYIDNVDGEMPTVELARADKYNTSRIIGVATVDIPIGGEGDITVLGDVSDLDMTGCTPGEV